jgi:hypothetical protein
VTKTVMKARPAARPALEGRDFLERTLERALGALDADASLSDAERAAAKTALAAALAQTTREILAETRSTAGAKAGAKAAPPGRPVATAPAVSGKDFTPANKQDRPGYFRPPAAAIGTAEGESGEVRLTGGKATWLRLMPRNDPGKTWSHAALRTAMLKAGKTALPIFAAAREFGEVRADDGFGTYGVFPSAEESSGVAFCFRSGEIWAVDTYVQDALAEQQPNSAVLSLQAELTAAFESYVALLQRLGVPGPYRWVIGMDGLLGRSLTLPQGARAGFPRGYCEQDTVEVVGAYDGAGPTEPALQPFFDELYKACGIPVV